MVNSMRTGSGPVDARVLAIAGITLLLSTFNVFAGQANDVPVSEADIRIVSVEEGARSGWSVSGAGDVNGDGLADLIIGAPFADPILNVITRTDAGRSFVVFGGAENLVVVLEELDEGGGFIINGPSDNAEAGNSVSGIGDVNNDGYDDVLIGARGRDSVYLVYGKPDAQTVDLSETNSGQFEVFQRGDVPFFGWSVSGAGDFNGDGNPDFIAGGSNASLIKLGGSGTWVAIEPGSVSVSGAGDVNGDGFDDVLVESAIVYGRSSTATIDSDNLGSGGFRITEEESNALGSGNAGAGDVNGDGFADVILGDPEKMDFVGSAYVIYGSQLNANTDTDSLGVRGFRIRGEFRDSKGSSVSGAGDIDGDGLGDVLVGAPVNAGLVSITHGAYLVPGQIGAADQMIPDDATHYEAIGREDRTGQSVSGAGDLNGDGIADFVIGAGGADPVAMVEDGGESYAVFGKLPVETSATYRTFVRNGSSKLRPLGSNGDGSNASHPNSHAWIGFNGGSAPGLGSFASRASVTLYRDDIFAPVSATSNSWLVSTQRQDWNYARLKFRYFEDEIKDGVPENRLALYFAPTEVGPAGPFTRLCASVDTDRNIMTATVDQLGFFFIGRLPDDVIFCNGFD